jgi:hypothetical protein
VDALVHPDPRWHAVRLGTDSVAAAELERLLADDGQEHAVDTRIERADSAGLAVGGTLRP